jgi:hypothetical protein
MPLQPKMNFQYLHHMKQYLRYILLALPFAVLLFAGCDRDLDEDEDEFVYVDSEILRFGWFPVGSYWIYENDSAQGQLDSNYVTATNHYFRYLNSDSTVQLETYFVEIQENTRNCQRTFHPVGYGEEGSYSANYVEFAGYPIRVQYIDFFYFPSGRDSFRLVEADPSTAIINQFTNLQIHGRTYPNAIEVTSPHGNQPYEIASMVWVKDVGIVRKTYVDGSVWSLLRYYIAPS